MRHIILLVSFVLLNSCATTPEIDKIIQPQVEIKPAPAVSPEEIESALLLESDENWQDAFNSWNELAQKSEQPDQSKYYNRAALALYHFDQIEVIPGFYNDLDDDAIQGDALNHKNILLATAYFNNGKTYQSLTTLPDLETVTNTEYLIIALDTKADAVLNIGKPIQSSQLRIQKHALLSDEDDLNQSFSKIWESIHRITERSILKTLALPQKSSLRGWLELSLISRRSDMLPTKMEPWLNQWHTIYPDHEAQAFAHNLLAQSKDIYINPTKIALMLPLKGKLAKVSRAIQDGFLYAYYSSSEENKADIEIITVDPSISFKQQYDLAIEGGADLIVGPISKKSIAELSFQSSTDVTTLALNYSSDDEYTQNLFQYGLKPEDEAEQVADYTLLDRRYNAATLMPDTSWGARLDKAFSERYELLGGTVQKQVKYPAKSNDYGAAIKQMLNLTSSKSRHRTINTVIGQKTEFQPRRRQDIDVIFIGANARQARIIKPQLKFHYAQDIQVYATSHISSSKKSADNDRDLNGVNYVDMPWSLKGQNLQEYKDINQYWPVLNKTHGKLFALGIDAYRLIPQLKRLKLNPEEKYDGLTGVLSIDDKGRIHRELLLATYEKGLSVEINNDLSE